MALNPISAPGRRRLLVARFTATFTGPADPPTSGGLTTTESPTSWLGTSWLDGSGVEEDCAPHSCEGTLPNAGVTLKAVE